MINITRTEAITVAGVEVEVEVALETPMVEARIRSSEIGSRRENKTRMTISRL